MTGLLVATIEPKFSDEVIDYQVPWTQDMGEGENLTGTISIATSNGVEAEVMETVENVTRLRVSAGKAGTCWIDLASSTSAGQRLGIRLKISVTERD